MPEHSRLAMEARFLVVGAAVAVVATACGGGADSSVPSTKALEPVAAPVVSATVTSTPATTPPTTLVSPTGTTAASGPAAAEPGVVYEQVLVLGDGDGIEFFAPNHLALDAEDNLYVTEFVGGRVWVFSPSGDLLRQFAGAGEEVGQLNQPTGIAVDTAGSIYVGEAGASRVQKFGADGVPLAAWGKFGIEPGEFGSAMGIGINDDLGRIYVADHVNSRVQVFDPSGGLLFVFGVRGDAPGEMFLPIGVDIGPGDVVYVVDSGNVRVQTYSPDGEYIETFSTLPLFGPQVISVRDDGSFWVSGPADREVVLFSASGEVLATLTPPDGELRGPHGTETASDGTVWLADTGNNVVRAFRLVD